VSNIGSGSRPAKPAFAHGHRPALRRTRYRRVRHPWKERTLIRRRVVVRGRVQGVFFRETTRRWAGQRGVSGWVRNEPDGSVEAVFEGEPEAVERMVELVREGPRGARVEGVDVVEEEPEGLTGFGIA
jgi:acylphosphatase